MNRILRNSGWIAVSLLSVGALLAGCAPGSAKLPLTLYVDTVAAAQDELIVIALDNPTKCKLFVPAAWTGIAVYKELATGNWMEYKYPDSYQPMRTTSAEKVLYSFPAAAFEPGSYKLVLMGRMGSAGTPFFLETDLDIGLLPLSGAERS